MANEYSFFGVLFILVGLYFLIRPMSLAVVSGKEWEKNPGKAKKKQKRKAIYWGVSVIVFGLILIFFAPSG